MNMQPPQPSRPSHRILRSSRRDDNDVEASQAPMYAIGLPQMLSYFNPYFYGNAYVPPSNLTCESYTEFISHVWRTSWFYKWLSLCMRYNLMMATYCSNFVVFVIIILQNLDSHLEVSIFPLTKQKNLMVIVGVFDNSLISDKTTSRGIGILVPIGMIVFMVVLCFGHYLGGRKLRHKTLFLDKASISQCPNYHSVIDPECSHCQQKLQGIESIGHCLQKSSELIVLWDKYSFRRLWTVFEMGVYIGAKGSEHVQFLPIYMNAAMILWFVLISLIMTFTSVAGLVEPPDRKIGTSSIYIMAIASLLVFFSVFFWILRRQISLQQNMMSELKNFSLAKAECYREEDRHFVKLGLVDFKLPTRALSKPRSHKRRWLPRKDRTKRPKGCLACLNPTHSKRLQKLRPSGAEEYVADSPCDKLAEDTNICNSMERRDILEAVHPTTEFHSTTEVCNLEPQRKTNNETHTVLFPTLCTTDINNEIKPASRHASISSAPTDVSRSTILNSLHETDPPCDTVMSSVVKSFSSRKLHMWKFGKIVPNYFGNTVDESCELVDDDDDVQNGIRRFEQYVHKDLVATLNKKCGMYGGNVVLPLRAIIIPCFPMTWAVLDYNVSPLSLERIVSDVSYALSFAFIFGPLFGFICVKIATFSLTRVPQVQRTYDTTASKGMHRWRALATHMLSVMTSADYLILVPGGLLNVVVVLAIYMLWVFIYLVCLDLWYVLLLIYSLLLSFVLYVYSPARHAAQLLKNNKMRGKKKARMAKNALVDTAIQSCSRRATMGTSPKSSVPSRRSENKPEPEIA